MSREERSVKAVAAALRTAERWRRQVGSAEDLVGKMVSDTISSCRGSTAEATIEMVDIELQALAKSAKEMRSVILAARKS